MRIAIVLSAALLLSACNPFADDMAAVKELVSADFRDPASAQWRNLRKVEAATGETWVCGEVNAKNLMGAYAGFHGFVANERQGLAIVEPPRTSLGTEVGQMAMTNYHVARGFCAD